MLENNKVTYQSLKLYIQEIIDGDEVFSIIDKYVKILCHLKDVENALGLDVYSKNMLDILALSGSDAFRLKSLLKENSFAYNKETNEFGQTLSISVQDYSISFLFAQDKSIKLTIYNQQFERPSVEQILYDVVSIKNKPFIVSHQIKQTFYNGLNEGCHEDFSTIDIIDPSKDKTIYTKCEKVYYGEQKKETTYLEQDFWDETHQQYCLTMLKSPEKTPIIKHSSNYELINVMDYFKHKICRKQTDNSWEFSKEKTPEDFMLLKTYEKLEKTCMDIIEQKCVGRCKLHVV